MLVVLDIDCWVRFSFCEVRLLTLASGVVLGKRTRNCLDRVFLGQRVCWEVALLVALHHRDFRVLTQLDSVVVLL